MTPREKKILTLRFGLEDGVPHTFERYRETFWYHSRKSQADRGRCMLKLRKMMEDQEKDAEKRLFSENIKNQLQLQRRL